MWFYQFEGDGRLNGWNTKNCMMRFMGKRHLIQVMVKSGLGRAHLKRVMKNKVKRILLHAKVSEEQGLCTRVMNSLHKVLDKACTLMLFMVQ